MPSVTNRPSTNPTSTVTPPTLRQGATNSTDIKLLQTLLNQAGFNVGNVDGKFGPGTAAQVRAFQSEKGMTADGVVGPATWRALQGNGTAPTGPVSPTTPSRPTGATTPPRYFGFASNIGGGAKAIDAAKVRSIVAQHGSNVLIGVDSGALSSGDARSVVNAAKSAGARLHIYVEGPGGVTGSSWDPEELARTKSRAQQVGINTNRSQSAWLKDWNSYGWKEFTHSQLKDYKRQGFESAEIDNLYNGIARNPDEPTGAEHVAFYKEYARWFNNGEVPRLMLKNLTGSQLNAVADAIDAGTLPRKMFSDFHIAEEGTAGNGSKAQQSSGAARMGIKTLHVTDTYNYNAFGKYDL